MRRRTDFEAAPKRIVGTFRLDPEKVDEWESDILHDRPVVVYCEKGGSASQSVADRIRQSRPGVRYLNGGIKAWPDLGEPLED